MRKEDKVKLPPPLKLKLPQGYYVERQPDAYALYWARPYGAGVMHDLVGVFTGDSTAEEIQEYARTHWANGVTTELLEVLEKLVEAHDEEPSMLTEEEWAAARAAIARAKERR